MKVFNFGYRPVKAWVDHVPEVEEAAMQQLQNISAMPFIHRHVAVMPDVHWGNGTAVGSVIPTLGAIIPAAVGVDLFCGMVACKTNLTASQLPDNLGPLRSAIEAAIPHGRTNNGSTGDKGAWNGKQPDMVNSQWNALRPEFEALCAKYPQIAKCNHVSHLGTLGGGNHFISVCTDEDQQVWVMLHSGSRGVGNRIGSFFIEKAKEEMRRWFINLPDVNLAYLSEGSLYYNDYVRALKWAGEYATSSRDIMTALTMQAMREVMPGLDVQWSEQAVQCHHNYVSHERHFGENIMVTRKGAVRADEGMLGIIPSAMGQTSYIVRGKGNRDSFNSCSHGSGRLMSRTEAKKRFTVDEHSKATEGVECRKDVDVIDETPGAYKPVDLVMCSQADLVEVVHSLKEVLVVKG